jgi:drug/metabolite transporter (DMT)-like permease
MFGVFTNILSALFVGIVNVIIRSFKEIHFSVAASFQAMMTFSASLIVLIIYRSFVNTTFDYSSFTFSFWLLIILNGLLQCIMQICWINALYLDKAGRAASLTFLGIVLGYFSDYMTFDYHMSFMEGFGAALIVTCSCLVFAFKLTRYSK